MICIIEILLWLQNWRGGQSVPIFLCTGARPHGLFSVRSYLQEKHGFGSLDHKDGCEVEGEERDATHGCYQLVTQPLHILEKYSWNRLIIIGNNVWCVCVSTFRMTCRPRQRWPWRKWVRMRRSRLIRCMVSADHLHLIWWYLSHKSTSPGIIELNKNITL